MGTFIARALMSGVLGAIIGGCLGAGLMSLSSASGLDDKTRVLVGGLTLAIGAAAGSVIGTIVVATERIVDALKHRP